MECLIDSIGPFTGCNAPTPLFNMYLSQLPGIEFANIDQIASADQITWTGLWNDLQSTTAISFREDVVAEFAKRYQLKQIVQTVDLGKNIDVAVQPDVLSQASNVAGRTAGAQNLAISPGMRSTMYVPVSQIQ